MSTQDLQDQINAIKRAYAVNQEKRANAYPGSDKHKELTKGQNDRVKRLKHLGSLLNPRAPWN